MSNHNYSKYSNKKIKKNAEQPTNPVCEATVEVDVISETPNEVKMEVETVETVTLPSEVTGVVVNCAKLNIRDAASRDGAVIAVVNANDTLFVDTNMSDNNWLRVCTTDDAHGYCMRQYVNVTL